MSNSTVPQPTGTDPHPPTEGKASSVGLETRDSWVEPTEPTEVQEAV